MNREFDFLGEVYVNLKRSEIAYANYTSEGRTFLHAKNLKVCNSKIRELLLKNCYLLSNSLCRDSLEMISHYDVWIERWSELEKEKKPHLNDEFIFESDSRFPMQASKNLEDEFMKIKKG